MAASMCSPAFRAVHPNACDWQRRAACGSRIRPFVDFAALQSQNYQLDIRFTSRSSPTGCVSCMPFKAQRGFGSNFESGPTGPGRWHKCPQVPCMRDSSREETRTPVSTEEDRSLEDGDGRLLTRGGVKHNSGENSINGANGHAGPIEKLLPLNLVMEVAEKVATTSMETVAEVAHNTTEVLAETIEVAAKTVSVVGEIDPSVPNEEEALLEQDSAVRTVVFWVSAAVAFGTLLYLREGSGKASEFFAGYLLEQSLSVDNLFVFVVIFKYFKTPVNYQSRVLTYGIAGAVFFRAFMITLGAATLQRFEAINLLFAGVLLLSAYKLLSGSEDDNEDLSDNFIVNLCRRFIPVSSAYDQSKFLTVEDGVRKATPLLLTLAVVELSDVAFAVVKAMDILGLCSSTFVSMVDSIPAVFGVTRDPLIVFSSNIFAILGLRSLYTLISGSMAELDYLQPSVATVLGFIGSKMVIEYFGFHVSTEASLAVVAVVLGLGVGLSLIVPNEDEEEEET